MLLNHFLFAKIHPSMTQPFASSNNLASLVPFGVQSERGSLLIQPRPLEY